MKPSPKEVDDSSEKVKKEKSENFKSYFKEASG
jgi:hypothetical protein